jgi:anhydro-N-acetylmuramic acid kinase
MATAWQPVVALGLMSGTSKDGVDVVRLETDGEGVLRDVAHAAFGYPRALYERLVAVGLGDVPLLEVLRLERAVSEEYVAAIRASGLLDDRVQVIGVHGQTVRHVPSEGLTWQLGDPNLVAEKVAETAGRAVPVVMDFRRRDMAAGGQGAPLVPLFHAAMLGGKAGAILNIGGVANVSVVRGDGIWASDCGPGMGLLDQWVQQRTGAAFDQDGALALRGTADAALVRRALAELPFFTRPLPRSADRYEFNAVLEWLGQADTADTADGAATLAALTVAGIDRSLQELGAVRTDALWLAGGGPKNVAVVQGLAQAGWQVRHVQELGWQPLAVEAACFAWLAVRRLRGLPFSLATTTGARRPTVGGVVTA